MSEQQAFLSIAVRPAILRRALSFAVVVGAVLIAINHGDALLVGEMTSAGWWKAGLTVLVPYCVSTLSSVGAIRDAERQAKR